uniref:Uncharacterized protein n=1 Tax=Phenylobacterium glaciei TaxID=2803784 RepID=A0A974P102_9CAUL|nr:hypothetical protein JKL49_16620 [Phenylobacterium glaciei]
MELEEGLEDTYGARTRTNLTLVFISLFAIVFAIANGTLLNLFFKGMTSVRVIGLPVSLLLSFMVVVAEMALGFLLALFTNRPKSAPVRWLLISMVVIAALFEAVVLGMVSSEFELELPLLEAYPVLKLWMAPFGLVLVTATSITGFMFHQTLDEHAEHRGATRLRRELKQASDFVRDLPGIWEKISQKAREAEHALKSYLSSLGGHDGRIGGSIEQIVLEHEKLVETIRDARVDEWRPLVAGAIGDKRRAIAQNIGLFVFTVASLAGFSAALSFLATAAIGTRLPPGAGVSMSIVVALGFYSTGLLAFGRLQLVEGRSDGRIPSGGVIEYAVSAIIVVGCASASCGLRQLCLAAGACFSERYWSPAEGCWLLPVMPWSGLFGARPCHLLWPPHSCSLWRQPRFRSLAIFCSG